MGEEENDEWDQAWQDLQEVAARTLAYGYPDFPTLRSKLRESREHSRSKWNQYKEGCKKKTPPVKPLPAKRWLVRNLIDELLRQLKQSELVRARLTANQEDIDEREMAAKWNQTAATLAIEFLLPELVATAGELAKKHLPNHEREQEDAASEALVHLYAKVRAGAYRETGACIAAWMWTVLSNKVRDYARAVYAEAKYLSSDDELFGLPAPEGADPTQKMTNPNVIEVWNEASELERFIWNAKGEGKGANEVAGEVAEHFGQPEFPVNRVYQTIRNLKNRVIAKENRAISQVPQPDGGRGKYAEGR